MLIRVVVRDGIATEIPLTPEEEGSLRAEWAAQAAQTAVDELPTVEIDSIAYPDLVDLVYALRERVAKLENK